MTGDNVEVKEPTAEDIEKAKEELRAARVEDEAKVAGKKAIMQFTVTAFDDATVGIGLSDGESNLWVIRGILATALTQVCSVSINKAV